MSPHSSITLPCWMIITAEEWMESAYWRASASLALDQPVASGEETSCQDWAGKAACGAGWARSPERTRQALSRKRVGRNTGRDMLWVLSQTGYEGAKCPGAEGRTRDKRCTEGA